MTAKILHDKDRGSTCYVKCGNCLVDLHGPGAGTVEVINPALPAGFSAAGDDSVGERWLEAWWWSPADQRWFPVPPNLHEKWKQEERDGARRQ